MCPVVIGEKSLEMRMVLPRGWRSRRHKGYLYKYDTKIICWTQSRHGRQRLLWIVVTFKDLLAVLLSVDTGQKEMRLKQYSQTLGKAALCSPDKAEQGKLWDWQRAKEYFAVLLKVLSENKGLKWIVRGQWELTKSRTRHGIGKANNAKNKFKYQRLHVHEKQCLVNSSVTGVAHLN